MRATLFICSQLLILNLIGQDILWEQCLGGSLSETELYTYVHEDGSIFIIGSSNSSDFLPQGNMGAKDAFVLRVDEYGEILESHSYGGSSSDDFLSMTIVNDARYFLGTSYSTDGDVNNDAVNADAWLVKTDDAGTLLWSVTIGGTGSDFGMDMAPTADGGVVCGILSNSSDGDFPANGGAQDVWLVKLDAAGDIVWTNHYGSAETDRVEGVKRLSDGSFVLVGLTDVQEGPGSNNDFLIHRVAPDGTTLSTQTFGGSGNEFAFDALELPGGDILVGGYSSSDDGEVSANHGSNDAWILRMDSEGNFIDEQHFGGSETDLIHSMAASPWGSIFLAGSTSSTDFDIISMQGDRDFWLLEIDGQGQIIRSDTYGGSGFEYLNTIAVAPDGKVFLSGKTDSANGDIHQAQGNDDGWIVRIGYSCVSEMESITETMEGALSVQDDFLYYAWYLDGVVIPGESGSSITPTSSGDYTVTGYGLHDCYASSQALAYTFLEPLGLTQLAEDKLHIFPNPAIDEVRVHGLSEAPAAFKTLSMDGKLLSQGQVIHGTIPLSAHATGMYLLEIRQGEQAWISRIQVVR